MSKDIYLTGITTTGTPHIGNYVGAIRPCIEASKDRENMNYYFLADLCTSSAHLAPLALQSKRHFLLMFTPV